MGICMNTLEQKITLVKKKISHGIDNNSLFNVLFEMNRYFDKQFVAELHDKNIKLDQNKRNQLRKYYYYGIDNILEQVGLDKFAQYKANTDDITNVLDSFINRCNKYDENKIIMSILERLKKTSSNKNETNCEQWLDWYNQKRKRNSEYSLFIYDYSQEDFVKDNYNINNILKIIADSYDNLENYRRFVFKLNGKLFNENNEDVTWKILYKVGIYCENFIQFKKDFFPFKKESRINNLTDFLNQRFKNKKNNLYAKDFYSSVSTGYKFEDCLVCEKQKHILLIFQKIELDKSPVPCPVCMTTIQNGNSFPEMFLRSYECKNQFCSERSKSGRGKRFDEFGTYRYFKLVENKEVNIIEDELYATWRRDIFSDKDDIYEMLIKYYAWDNEIICTTKDISIEDTYERNLILYKPQNCSSYNYDFDKLPICIFFDKINDLIKSNKGTSLLKKDINILNENSSIGINKLKKNQIGTAITSPPYYNAREYSQWRNLLMYLIDMMINCKSVFNTLIDNGYYLYNIGDIVNNDNIYVESNMSKKRLQLGFLSCLIFEKAGFNLVGNIIWDKGEVQSKRNSTMNHNSGYVKCINCYEHVFVFKKGNETRIFNDVVKIKPVIKINSKGENTYKHTAPYPLELVDLIKDFVTDDKYILDPFLGSGTTLKWCKIHGYKGIGYELNSEYYLLAQKYINECCNK